MGSRPYKLRDTHRHHQHHRSRSAADAQRNAVAVTDASGGREVSAAAPTTSTSVQNFFQDEGYDLGDDWLSEDEQLLSLLVDDVERQTREAKLRQQTEPTLSASTRRDLPSLPRQHLNLRRSITDIEDYYATSNVSGHSASRSPKVARRGGHQCHSLDTVNETRLIEGLWRQRREKAPIAQNEEGEGKDSTSPTALSRVDATGVRG
ncbi:plasma membrane H+-ATPase, partial [Ascosphaera pollenicola]